MLEELTQKMSEKQDENDYLNEKVAKMETQYRELRLSKDPKAELKKLESEVAYLRQQLNEYQKQDPNKSKNDNLSAGFKKELSLDEQVRI